MEKAARDRDGESPVAIQRVKPNPRPSLRIMDVSANIEFEKPRHPREGRKPRGANALHRKGHDPKVSRSSKGIDVEPTRQAGLHSRRIDFPVRKQQLIPSLAADERSVRALSLFSSLRPGRGQHEL